ncbi:hypothetical protein WICPIJ_000431 [Wickerhamomyces pijperi]|uniref:Apyrase n=1 Tax=Wickerhamomyces pijperi TaxID=599730 RepID=A0A9P8QGK2_WICPI|nr:hypothetical protein WICPIJ_000431 [Wickerhamomyces pijperi]
MKRESKLDHVIDSNHPHFDRYKTHGKQYLHDYIVIIDAGSKGTRAHLYRTKSPYQIVSGPDDTVSETKRDHSEDHTDSEEEKNYIEIELVKRTKLKPGIAMYKDSLSDLHDKYFGKLLEKIESHIPKSQISRTPIFVHATGGVRLLPIEKQEKMMASICEYLQGQNKYYLPDCKTHVDVIDGELEGLYSWIGVNYKQGVFNYEYPSGSNYGVFDLGGASTQLAFAPNSEGLSEDDKNGLYRLNLHYNPNKHAEALSYDVFTQSYNGGVDQITQRYQKKIKAAESKEDPCLSKGSVASDGIKGTGDFAQCYASLNELLKEVSAERYCEQEDKSKCSLNTYLPSKNYKFDNVKNFVGVNEFHDSLEDFESYKEFYEKTVNLCSGSKKTSGKDKDSDSDSDSQECFKSAWVINILHESLGFPLYDEQTISESSIDALDSQFQTLKKTSWTLGHAVLYQYDSIAMKQSHKPHQKPLRVGYFSPRSTQFTYGGEQEGVTVRPAAKTPYEETITDDHDDDKDDDGIWDHVQENHRLYGGLIIFVMLFAVLYLLFGKKLALSSKVYGVKQWIKGKFNFNSTRFTKLTSFDEDLERAEVELGQLERSLAEQDEEGNALDDGRDAANASKDSFEI